MYKIVGSDQKIYGPVSAEQIRQWLREGRVDNSTLIQTEGSNDWKPLSSVPEFGTPPVVSMPPAQTKPDNNLATIGLACGILANVICCFGWFFGVLGLVFSAIALGRHNAHYSQGSKGMALAGLILSVIGLTWPIFLPANFMGFQPNHFFWWSHPWRHW